MRHGHGVLQALSQHSGMPRIAVLVALLALASIFAGCGPTTAATVGGGPPAVLQCSQASVGHGVDVVNMKLTCHVSGAASGDSSFALHYSIKNGNGVPRTFDATCAGTLSNGAGTCTQTYALVVPFDSGSASVTGEFLPSHKQLGPMPLPINQ
ncbi:MAG: hypothetical protein ACM3N4_12370 [Nitrososphaerota archaeon]